MLMKLLLPPPPPTHPPTSRSARDSSPAACGAPLAASPRCRRAKPNTIPVRSEAAEDRGTTSSVSSRPSRRTELLNTSSFLPPADPSHRGTYTLSTFTLLKPFHILWPVSFTAPHCFSLLLFCFKSASFQRAAAAWGKISLFFGVVNSTVVELSRFSV